MIFYQWTTNESCMLSSLSSVYSKISCIENQICILSNTCIIFVHHNWLYVYPLFGTQPPWQTVIVLKSDLKSTFVLVLNWDGLAQVSCSLCNETMERDILDIHKGENCPQRIVTCEFCEFPLPAIDLAEHQVVFIKNFQAEKILYTFALISVWYLYLSGSMWESNRTLSHL